jgi:hypothetical protein
VGWAGLDQAEKDFIGYGLIHAPYSIME